MSDATIRNSAKLVADICKRYNIPITRDRIKRHGEITKTQCCGGLDIDKLVKYAQDIANGVQQNNYLIKKGDKKMTIVFSYKGVGYSAIDGTMIAFTENKYWDKVNSIASKNGTLSDLGEISEAQYNQFVKAYKFGK